VVWGPFSIVWGLAIALVTKLLYAYKDRPASFLFAAGTLLGGAYEYLCSVFTELVFGTVFWDYSHIPFNLGGRINLLYCFFWGFAAVAWFKLLYPPVGRLIERIPARPGKALTWVLVVFMAANILVSSAALARVGQRADGAPAANRVEVWLDEHYDDATMARIYPNAIRTE
ncbi:MAG: putative ABC transporter permease, partial [Gemmiger sp.]